MPLKIPNSLPATQVLEQENIFCMTETRALHQDIRPLKIAILNLMPTKITTETQLLRALSNTPLQVEIDLIQTATYMPKTISQDHLSAFYKTFDEIKHRKYDGMIITGAPVENLEFSEVELPVLDKIYDAWSFNAIPKIGKAVTGDADSYQYLVESIRKFPRQADFAEMIRTAGFERVSWRNFTGGIAALHSGWKL